MARLLENCELQFRRAHACIRPVPPGPGERRAPRSRLAGQRWTSRSVVKTAVLALSVLQQESRSQRCPLAAAVVKHLFRSIAPLLVPYCCCIPFEWGVTSMVTRSVPVGKTALTAWEHIWYTLQCLALGIGYFAKIPAKKAFHDFGMGSMTRAEKFWYVLMLGGGYFAKVPVAKALSELPGQRELTRWERFWYSVSCLYFGAGYFAKVHAKKALSDFAMAEMTAGERAWYAVLCLPFGAGYFAKIPVAKAITELPERPVAAAERLEEAPRPVPVGRTLTPAVPPASATPARGQPKES